MLPPRRVHSRTTARGVDARQMPLAGLRQALVVSRDTCAVAAVQRGARITREAYFVASALERARYTRVGRSRGAATRRRAPRGAACGPLPAGRCIRHSHTSSVTHAAASHSRDSTALPAPRLPGGDRPARLARLGGHSTAQVETLPLAHHARDPPGGPGRPPPGPGAGRPAPPQA